MNQQTRLERNWHRVIIVCSTIAVPFGWVLPATNPLRHLAGLGFVFLIPGMAVAARTPILRSWGLMSAATWAVVVPISFAVGVAGSLAMVYLLPWWPGALAVLIAAAAIASSLQRLRSLGWEAGS